MFAMLKLVLASFAILAVPSVSYAAQCPADATTYSLSVWPAHTIPHHQSRSAMQPCGKRLTCDGGSKSTPRTCSWH